MNEITLEEFYKNSWRKKCGIKELEFTPLDKKDIAKIYETEWSQEFIDYMHNRLVMGSFRYGDIRVNKGNYDYIEYLQKKLKYYQDTGNTEYLVDVANLALLEFINSEHPNKHFFNGDNIYKQHNKKL